jgi:hypothetical protein
MLHSVGSGIEHAEGGGAGGTLEGFQIWVNVPSARKMDEPRYGTEPPAAIPLLRVPGGEARVLAGSCGGAVGPFKTVTAVEIVDYSLAATGVVQHHVASELDNALVFCYRGSGSVCGAAVRENSITLLKADDQENRSISLQSGRSVTEWQCKSALLIHTRAATGRASLCLRGRGCGRPSRGGDRSL